MHLTRLEAYNFRNLRALKLEPHLNTSVIAGSNGSGKTNILEAINLTATLRSHRVSNDKDLVMRGENAFAVHLYINRADVEEHLKLEYNLKKSQKRAYIDDKKMRRLSDFVGNLKVVLFTPEDLTKIRNSPDSRRNLIDMWIMQVKPSYVEITNRYLNILKQRNALLREIAGGGKIAEGQLEIWTDKLLEVGSDIIKTRGWSVELLSQPAEEFYDRLSPEDEKLTIEYRPNVDVKSLSFDDIKEAFSERLGDLRRREMERGLTLAGPQRDDIVFLLNGREADLYASQGQTRLMAFAYRLSEHRMMSEAIDEVPVFLLDDLNSELDAERLDYAFKLLPTIGQVILTTTDENIVSKVRGGENEVFHIEDGELAG